jgi:hypothetical protein
MRERVRQLVVIYLRELNFECVDLYLFCLYCPVEIGVVLDEAPAEDVCNYCWQWM